MDDRRYEQLGAATGILFVGLAAVAFFAAGSPPGQHSTADDIVAFIGDKRTALLVSNFVWIAASAVFLWFLGSLRATLHDGEGERSRLSTTAYGAGIVAMVVFLVGSLPLYALTYRGLSTTDPNLVRTFWDMSLLANNVVGNGAVIVFVGAASLVIVRSRILPVWVAELGGLAIVASAVGMTGPFFNTGAWAIDSVVPMVGFGVTLLWFLGMSVAMVMHYSPAHAGAPRPAATHA